VQLSPDERGDLRAMTDLPEAKRQLVADASAHRWDQFIKDLGADLHSNDREFKAAHSYFTAIGEAAIQGMGFSQDIHIDDVKNGKILGHHGDAKNLTVAIDKTDLELIDKKANEGRNKHLDVTPIKIDKT
jgi:hypothetical protein